MKAKTMKQILDDEDRRDEKAQVRLLAQDVAEDIFSVIDAGFDTGIRYDYDKDRITAIIQAIIDEVQA